MHHLQVFEVSGNGEGGEGGGEEGMVEVDLGDGDTTLLLSSDDVT